MAGVIRYVQAARGAGDEYFTFTAPAVEAVAGNYLLVVVDCRKTGGDSPAHTCSWNGESIPEVYTPYIAFTSAESGNEDQMKRVSFFGNHLTTSATADATCSVDGFKAGNITAFVCDSVNTGTALSALFSQQVWSTYSNPSLGATGVAAGDVVLFLLASTNYSEGGYGDGSATVWTPGGGQTAISSMSSSEPRTGQFLSSSKTGTGTVTGGYSPSTSGNNYAHFAIVLKDAGPAVTIDSITTGGNPGLVVGEPFAITTTGLGTITSITVTTAATPAATTSAINLSAGAGELKYWVATEFYPFPGTVTVEATDGTLTASGSFSLDIPTDHLDVIFNSVETTDATYIGTKLAEIGHPLANNDRGNYPTGNALAIGTNGHVSCLGAMTFVLWIHKVSGVIERYDVVINDAGEITDVTGITSRGITSRAVTSRVVTSRGI